VTPSQCGGCNTVTQNTQHDPTTIHNNGISTSHKHPRHCCRTPEFLLTTSNNQLDLVHVAISSDSSSTSEVLTIQQRLVFAIFTPVASHKLPVSLPPTKPPCSRSQTTSLETTCIAATVVRSKGVLGDMMRQTTEYGIWLQRRLADLRSTDSCAMSRFALKTNPTHRGCSGSPPSCRWPYGRTQTGVVGKKSRAGCICVIPLQILW
jgi:hypothetical protein